MWASHGGRGDCTDHCAKAGLERLPNWHFTVFDTGAMPDVEVPEAVDSAFTRFLE